MNVNKNHQQSTAVVECVDISNLTERQALEMSEYMYEMIRRDVRYFKGAARSLAVAATAAAFCDAATAAELQADASKVSARCFLCHYARQARDRHNKTAAHVSISKCDFCHVNWVGDGQQTCADEGSPYAELAALVASESTDFDRMRAVAEDVQGLFRARLSELDARDRRAATAQAGEAIAHFQSEESSDGA